MEHFFTFFSMSLIFLVVPLVLTLIRTRAAKFPDKEVIKFPKFVPILGAFGFIMFVALGLWALLQGSFSNVIAGIVFVVIVLSITCPIFLWTFLMGVNWKLILDEEQLIYRNLWGRVKRINYQDITGIKTCYAKKSDIVQGYIIYIGKKRIVIQSLATNLNTFPKTIKKRLNKFNNKIVFE